MSDLVLKQVVAVIDNRTSVVCLHAAGQTRPLADPFETLLGPQEDTPFHWRCRSMVVPWMPGFVSTIRKDANAELQRRPLKQRRIGPGGVTGPLPPRVPDNPKLPDGVSAIGAPTREEIDAFIDRADETLDLSAVPANMRREFVEANPDRFEMTSNGGGISETYWVKDLQTGDRYVLKAGQYHNESVAEVIGTRVQNAAGFSSEVLVASDMATGNGWVLLKHAEDMATSKSGGYKVVGTSGSHAQQAKLAPRMEAPEEAVRKLVVDFAIDEADAKGGNMLLLSKDGGKTVRLAPIDRSLSQMGWREAVEPGKTSVVTGDWSLAGRLKVTDLRGYMKTRGSPKGVLELVQGLAETADGRRLVVEAYDDTLARLKAIDLKTMTLGLPDELVAENVALIEARIALLESKRTTILKQMGVSDVDTPPAPVLTEALSDAADGQQFLNALVEYEMAGARTSLPRFQPPRVEMSYDDLKVQMPEAMREVEEAFGRLTDEFPGAMGLIKQVRIGQTAGQGSLAEYRAAYQEITIDWQELADLPGLQAKFDKMAAAGWFTKMAPGTRATTYMIEHEVGHHLDALLKTAGDGKSDPWPSMWRKIGLEMRAAGLDVKSGTKARDAKAIAEFGKTHLSTYSGGDEMEFIAEAFAEFRTSASPGPIARIVGEAFEDAYGAGRRTPPAVERTAAAQVADDDALAHAAQVAEEEAKKKAAEEARVLRDAEEEALAAEARKRKARADAAVEAAQEAAEGEEIGTSEGLPYALNRTPMHEAMQIANTDPKKYGDAGSFMSMQVQGRDMMGRALARGPKTRAMIESWVPALREVVEAEGNRVVVAVPATRLESLLKADRWKSAFEAKTTAGKGVGGYLKARQFYEDVLMGLPDSIEKKARPIYGYVTDASDLKAASTITDTGYGSVHFVMKSDVIDRSTITMGDSLNGWTNPRTLEEFKATPDSVLAQENAPGTLVWDIDEVEAGTKQIPQWIVDSGLRPHDYVEAQVHGGLRLSDVESVIVDRSKIEANYESAQKSADSYRKGSTYMSARESEKAAKDYQKDADAALAELEAMDAMVVELAERGWNVVVR